MSSKTISISPEAYDKLKNARRSKNESFSQVLLRGSWPEETVTAGQLLELLSKTPPLLPDCELEAIDKAKRSQTMPADKWITR